MNQVHNNEKQKPEGCYACGFETDALKPYPTSRWMGFNREIPEWATTHKWLCQLCAGTMTGTAAEYPEQYLDSKRLMDTICYVGNAILKAIKEKS